MVPKPRAAEMRRLGQIYSALSGQCYDALAARSPEMTRAIERIFDTVSVDAVQSEFPYMSNNVPPSDALSVVDAHNIEYDTYMRFARGLPWGPRKLYYNGEYRSMREVELGVFSGLDGLLVTSRRDAAVLDEDVPDVPKFVVPNGVDTNYFRPAGIRPEPHSMVFMGAMSYLPNDDAMTWFLDEVFPRILRRMPDAKIYIVGGNPLPRLKARASENVIVTGYVGDIRPFVWRSSVVVVPLRMGGGTRLKVLEGMAMGKCVVSTSIGCEGIEVSNGEECFIEDDPATTAELITTLLRDRRLGEIVARRAREAAVASYDWKIVCGALRRAYRTLLSYGPARRSRPADAAWQFRPDALPGRPDSAPLEEDPGGRAHRFVDAILARLPRFVPRIGRRLAPALMGRRRGRTPRSPSRASTPPRRRPVLPP
jgi:glycosyltransferase involved in cell wall biosynthesis